MNEEKNNPHSETGENGASAYGGSSDEAGAEVSLKKPVYCSHCGNKQSAGDKFCTSCGLPFGQPALPENTGYGGQRDSYGAEEIEALYVGKKTEYFLPRFRSMRVSGGMVKWNWAAFFVAPLWLIYRKMYLYGIGILIAAPILSLLGIERISIAFGVCVGMMGNYWYMKRIGKLIEESREMTDADRAEHIRECGGTSGKAVWIAILAHRCGRSDSMRFLSEKKLRQCGSSALPLFLFISDQVLEIDHRQGIVQFLFDKRRIDFLEQRFLVDDKRRPLRVVFDAEDAFYDGRRAVRM